MVLSMFKSEHTHKEFQSHLVFLLNVYFGNEHFFKTVVSNALVVFKVFLTDLIPVRDILFSTYHSRGEKPWDPACLFRSYWLMCQYGNRGSITRWVQKLKSEPFWAIVSGFNPGNTPGVGTFYDFEDRLCDFDTGHRVQRCTKMHKPLSKPKKKLKKTRNNRLNTRISYRSWLIVSLEMKTKLNPRDLTVLYSKSLRNVLSCLLLKKVSLEILLTWLFPVTA